jgi:hypothetical protein
MRTFPLDIAGSIRRSRLLTPLLFIIGLVVAYVSAGYIVSGDFNSLAFVAMIATGAVATAAILGNWRNGTYVFLAWLLFEDFARKFLGNNMDVYFAKDFLVLLVYLSFFAAYRRKENGLQTFARLSFRFFWSLFGLAPCRCSTPPPPVFFTVSSA